LIFQEAFSGYMLPLYRSSILS